MLHGIADNKRLGVLCGKFIGGAGYFRTKEQARKLWMDEPEKTFVYEEDGKIFGTYYIKTNHAGPGDHVCNYDQQFTATTDLLSLSALWSGKDIFWF